MPKRYLHNSYVTNVEQLKEIYLQNGNLKDTFSEKLQQALEEQLRDIVSHYENENENISVYTGLAGIAFMFYQLHKGNSNMQCKGKSMLEWAVLMILKCRKRKAHDCGFICTQVGLLATTVVVFMHARLEKEAFDNWSELVKLCQKEIQNPSSPCELLYGKAGLIYALLFVLTECNGFVDDTETKKWIHCLRERIMEEREPLTPDSFGWQWHGKYYLGAAHGVAGISAILFKTMDENNSYVQELRNNIRRVVHEFVDNQGTFPASLTSGGRDLMQFCHGPPGLLLSLVECFSPSDPIFQEMKACRDAIWRKCLLNKGVGICHGMAGNAFSFLSLFKCLGDSDDLAKACFLADQCVKWHTDTSNGILRLPDNPYSLFEGTAGMVLLWNNLLHIDQYVGFPAFSDIPNISVRDLE